MDLDGRYIPSSGDSADSNSNSHCSLKLVAIVQSTTSDKAIDHPTALENLIQWTLRYWLQFLSTKASVATA